MEVRTIGVTQPGTIGFNGNYFDPNIKTPEDIVVYCARVSNPKNQANMDTGAGLIRYCIKNKHWSIFETVNLILEITTTRDIGRQILRHRSFSFQELCIAEGSKIYCEMNNGNVFYIPIERLFKKQKHKNYKNIKLRIYDENKKEFSTSKIKEVFDTGIKPVYRITLTNKKQIECTKEHKFYTQEGFKPLEEIVGLDVKYHTMSKNGYIATNGLPVYQNFEWMQKKRDLGLTYKEIGDPLNISEHTIHKWIKNLGLSDKKNSQKRSAKTQKRLYGGVWNKGKYGYNINLVVSEEHKQKIREARSGNKSNWWKGGVDRGFRQEVWDFCHKNRKQILEKFNYICQKCLNKGGKLELHHKIPVFEDKLKAFDLNNLEPLCKKCHNIEHNIFGHPKIWREKHKGNFLSIKWVKIEKIEYIGEKQTYDIEVDSENHNYVANGILVHNSQRYAQVDAFDFRDARLQDNKNRQNSIETDNENLKTEWFIKQTDILENAKKVYKWALDNGIAKEQARVVLPEGMSLSRLYMNGNLRSWITYISLREKNGTQAEHREVALMCKERFSELFPIITEALGGKNVEWNI